MRRRQAAWAVLAGLGLIVAITGCAPGDRQPQDVEARAEARWSHMVERDFQSAHAYYPPGFREMTPAADFAADMKRRPVRWEAVEVLGSDCGEDRCTVRVRVTYGVTSGPEAIRNMSTERVLEETWIRVEGRWWYSP